MKNLIVIIGLGLMSCWIDPALGLQRDRLPAPETTPTFQLPDSLSVDQQVLGNPMEPIGPMQGNRLQRALSDLQKADTREDKSVAKDSIKDELERQYDAFLERDQRKVDQLFDRLKKLEEQLEKRREAKDRLVELKLEMLVSQAEGLGWPTDQAWNSGPGYFPMQSPMSPEFPAGPGFIPNDPSRLNPMNPLAPSTFPEPGSLPNELEPEREPFPTQSIPRPRRPNRLK